MESILTTIKKLVGLMDDDDSFDLDLIVHINSVILLLTQIGIGPEDGFFIQDNTSTWEDFLGEGKNINAVKSYVYLKVKTLFDPPLSSAVAESLDRIAKEFEWRLYISNNSTPVVPEPSEEV